MVTPHADPETQSLPPPGSTADRMLGSLFGLLLGDACGVPVEFSGRDLRDRDPVTSLRGWGCHHQPPGHWSDDGSLMLAHIAAFLDHPGWQPEGHLREFATWYETGRHSAGGVVFDVGNATARALLRHLSGSPWYACGCRGSWDNGNGSLMRILPVSLWLWKLDPSTRFRIHAEASALTHGHRRSELSCILYGELCIELLRGVNLPDTLLQAGRVTRLLHQETEWHALADICSGEVLERERSRIQSTGYVIHCLEAALWCLKQHSDFRSAVLEAVNLGGDTDTTAAVCGSLAGLRCGYSGLPRDWIDCLPRKAYLYDLTLDFLNIIR